MSTIGSRPGASHSGLAQNAGRRGISYRVPGSAAATASYSSYELVHVTVSRQTVLSFNRSEAAESILLM